MHFPDCFKHTCINAAYSDFAYKFMRTIDSFKPIS